MTLNGVMAVALRYFAEFGKHASQHITAASICGGMHESIVFCSTCTMSSYRKFTFAISSPDEFLVNFNHWARVVCRQCSQIQDIPVMHTAQHRTSASGIFPIFHKTHTYTDQKDKNIASDYCSKNFMISILQIPACQHMNTVLTSEDA